MHAKLIMIAGIRVVIVGGLGFIRYRNRHASKTVKRFSTLSNK